jgi:hypothetical protein
MSQKGSFLSQLCWISENSLKHEDEDDLVKMILTYATDCVDQTKKFKEGAEAEFKKILKAQETAFDFIKKYVYVFDENLSREKISEFAKGMIFKVNSKKECWVYLLCIFYKYLYFLKRNVVQSSFYLRI